MLKPHTRPDQTFHAPTVRLERDGGLRLVIAGSWTVREIPIIEEALGRLRLTHQPGGAPGLEFDLAGLSDLDTAGAWRILQLIQDLQKMGFSVRVARVQEGHQTLLKEVNANRITLPPAKAKPFVVVALVADAIRTLGAVGRDLVELTAMLGAVTLVFGRNLIKPWRFRLVSFVHHLEHVGLRAVPIISLICVLIGAVVMQQGVVQLRPFGAEPFAVNMLGILTLREVGILLTSIMVAGRSASAFTAEIGTMKMREEIDAMRTLGIDPLETLVLPRILALLVALPLLTFWGDIMCLIGGGVMAKIYLGLDPELYLQKLHDAVSLRHFLVGLVKAPFAALIIGLVGCLEGMRVRGSAESLGFQVTNAVVKAIFLVIILDAVFAIFLSAAGY